MGETDTGDANDILEGKVNEISDVREACKFYLFGDETKELIKNIAKSGYLKGVEDMVNSIYEVLEDYFGVEPTGE